MKILSIWHNKQPQMLCIFPWTKLTAVLMSLTLLLALMTKNSFVISQTAYLLL